ncbi:MAG: endolytic transglycosylase MltG [Eubacteriales bacterium]
MKNTKNKFPIVIISIIVIALLFFATAFVYISNSSKPINPNNKAVVNLEIPKGSSSGEIARLLYDSKLIGNELVFKIKTKIGNYGSLYKAGYYSLNQSMSMDEIMNLIKKGSALTVRFTIPEGFDIKRISERLVSQDLIDAGEFQKQVENGNFDYYFLSDAPKGKNHLEGYLYPDTYEVFPNASEEEIINKMLARFDEVFTMEYKDQLAKSGLNMNELITLASIIEREAKVPADRPVIASVFYNRLKIKMPLQSCATVQYILGEQKEKLTLNDIAIDSPYNTYKISGLPPGPICSPGLESIKAALYPAKTEYLYFLAKGDGSSVFSTTYDEFLADKAKYIN